MRLLYCGGLPFMTSATCVAHCLPPAQYSVLVSPEPSPAWDATQEHCQLQLLSGGSNNWPNAFYLPLLQKLRIFPAISENIIRFPVLIIVPELRHQLSGWQFPRAMAKSF